MIQNRSIIIKKSVIKIFKSNGLIEVIGKIVRVWMRFPYRSREELTKIRNYFQPSVTTLVEFS